MSNPLDDQIFLEQLYNNSQKITHIKTITYDIFKRPIEQLEGIAIDGNINIDSTSNVRRSCNITMLVDDQNLIVHDSYWGMSTQFQLFIGVENFISFNYEPIIWFPMGWYLINSFSITEGLNSKKINLQGKDKMCALNGDMGGNFTNLSTVLNKKTIQSDNINEPPTVIDLTFDEIIKNLLITFGNENEYNIIIRDLDAYPLKELLTYNGKEPLYIYLQTTVDENGKNKLIPFKATLDKDEKIKNQSGAEILISDEQIIYHENGDLLENEGPTTLITSITNNQGEIEDIEIQLARILPGQNAGYRYTELTYPGELIANNNETITSILDKIINFFPTFEYFYNTEGQFVFQKKNYIKNEFQINLAKTINVSFLDLEDEENRLPIKYNFHNCNNITQLNNNYQLANIKNDYVIWGKRQDIPICLRIALDNKPSSYVSYNNEDDEIASVRYTTDNYDWREIIYQMAIDKHKHGHKSDFYKKLITNNPTMINGKTGYEQYYIDMQSYWRQLYDPNPQPIYQEIKNPNKFNGDIYIDKYAKITGKTIKSNEYDKNLIYKYDNNTKHLQKYIDTLNFNALYYNDSSKVFTTSDDENKVQIPLNHMYYYQNQLLTPIIDSINFEDYNVYINSGEDWVPLYLSLNEIEKERVYYTNSKYSTNYKKMQNYCDVKNYFVSDISISNNQLFLNDTIQNTMIGLHEIWLNKNNQSICLWQNTGDTLNEEIIDMLAEAVHNYSGFLSFLPEDGDLTAFNKNQHKICVLGEKIIQDDNMFFWYKTAADGVESNEPNEYVSLIKYKLTYNYADTTYGKYYVKLKTKNGLQSVLDVISVNKNQIYEYIEDSGEAPALIINKYDFPSGDYYLSTNNKVQLNDDQNDMLPFEVYWDENNELYINNFAYDNFSFVGNKLDNTYLLKIKYYEKFYEYYLNTDGVDKQYWNKEIYNDFNKATYWLDFIDDNYDFTKYGVKYIGQKQKVINNNNLTGISFQDNMAILYTISDKESNNNELYITSELFNCFSPSVQGSSCLDQFNNILYSSLKRFNSISCNIIPYYNLQVNDLIYISCNYKDIDGNYIITKINIPLKFNGVMQITGQKA